MSGPLDGPDSGGSGNGQDEPPRLRQRDPRPLALHAFVDALIAFLALVIVLVFLGIPIWVTGVIAAVLGICAAPYTRRAEVRALAKRPPPLAEG